MATVTTLLLDADGVVQHNERVFALLTSMLHGRATLDQLLEAEQRTMVGTEDLADVLAEFVTEHDVPTTARQFLDVWCDTEPDAEALALVGRVRAHGTPVCLATNQQAVRGQWMLDTLDYADRFDRIFASFQLGVAKPSAGFFHHIVDELGVDAASVLFIDDVEGNVQGAREVGLLAEWHDPASGVADLERILDAHGVRH